MEVICVRGRHDTPCCRSRFTRSSGNVFTDLGFTPTEAEKLQVRAELMGHLIEIIGSRGLTQSQAASLLGVTRSRISDLKRGKIHLFNVDSLIEMLGSAGKKVEVSVGRQNPT
jgi:predicted XRE-type DNA-binding protein